MLPVLTLCTCPGVCLQSVSVLCSSACLRRKCAHGADEDGQDGLSESSSAADVEKAVKLPQPCKGRADVVAILAGVCREHAQEPELGVIAAGAQVAPALLASASARQAEVVHAAACAMKRRCKLMRQCCCGVLRRAGEDGAASAHCMRAPQQCYRPQGPAIPRRQQVHL